MKQLKNKVFISIFLIFTIFLVFIIFFVNYDNYRRQKIIIRNNLHRVYNINYKTFNKLDNKEYKNFIREKLSSKIFMDYTIHTIILDRENNIIDIIKHKDSTKTNEQIFNIVNDILENRYYDDRIIINNLFTQKYSYIIDDGNFISIINNSPAKKNVTSMLKVSLLIFIFLEIIIYFLSKVFTYWIIKPAIVSFKKQKKFIEDASHELKTPLSVIIASVDNLKNETSNKNMIYNIETEANKMSNLLSGMLDLARIENYENKNTYTSNNISKICKKSILVMESLAYENNVSFKYNIQDNIYFYCDSDLINQLFSIMIDNAIKHSYKNKKINILLSENEDNIIFEIKNYGKEIPKEKQEYIFERFYRVDESRNRQSNSYGLGLSIAKNIIDNHNGKVIVDSKENTTTFKIIFKRTLKK